MLHTVGYEGAHIDEFVALLIRAGVEVLADVRAVPISRKQGFSKSALRTRLQSSGIDYLHFKGLGDPKAGREAARAGRVEEFKTIYKQHLRTGEALNDFARLETVVTSRLACLLCFERLPDACHRSIIADRFARKGFSVDHLYVESLGRHVRDTSKRGGRDPRQSAAAA